MIENITRKTIVSSHQIACTSFFSQTCGLMFRKPSTAVFLFKSPHRFSIHTWFVRFPMDLILVKDGEVVELAKNIIPWSTYTPWAKADMLIECPAGTINRSGTRLHDQITVRI